jgi:3-oxoacyl-[acyl-carrier protein] reductase
MVLPGRSRAVCVDRAAARSAIPGATIPMSASLEATEHPLPRVPERVALDAGGMRGRAVVVTGSAAGIGRALARRFAAEGARVVVADLDLERASRVAGEMAEERLEATPVYVDIADARAVAAMVDTALGTYGRIDVLVNNAGIGLNRPFLETTLEEWERQLRVNLTGPFLCGQAVARVMVGRGGGRIVNVGSISGQRGGQGRAAYGAAKAGVMHLTRTMAVELAPYGIAVNAVAPGPVDTEQSRGTHTPATRAAYHDRIPLGRYGREEEVAAAVRFLASGEASFVTGHVLNVDGGFGAAGLVFRDETT